MFGVNAQQFDRRFRPHIPDSQVITQGTGRVALFKATAVRAIVDAMVAEERDRSQLTNEEAMLSGDDGGDAGLRRFRMAKAQLAELELEQKRGELVAMQDIQAAFKRFAGIVRRGFASLGKKHGNQAKALAERTIDTAVEAVEAELMGEPDS